MTKLLTIVAVTIFCSMASADFSGIWADNGAANDDGTWKADCTRMTHP